MRRAPVICAALALLAGCASATAAGRISEVTAIAPYCAPECVDASATMRADGSATYGIQNAVNGTLGRAAFWQLAQAVAENPVVRAGKNVTSLPGIPTGSLLIRYGSRVRAIRFPVYPPLSAGDASDPAYQLNRLAELLIGDIHRAVQQPARLHIERWSDLREVSFAAGGGLCVRAPCGYDVTFSSDGAAQLDRGAKYRGKVPMAAARELLRESGAATLDPYYAPRWTDAVTATLTLKYAGGWTYRVYAPDYHTWPPQLHELDGAFSQLVRDIHWQRAPGGSHPQ